MSQNWKFKAIYASVYTPDTPDLLDLELYSSLLQHISAADNTGREHTSTWHFENPNRVHRPNIHRYSKLPVSTEIPGLVFSESFPTFIFLQFQ